MSSVWLVEEIYNTGAGPQATRAKEVFAQRRHAFAYVARLVAELVKHENEKNATYVAEVTSSFGRFLWWSMNEVRFHARVGPRNDIHGYTIVEMQVIETDLFENPCPFCGHCGPLVAGRDAGLMACADCGAQ